MPAEGVHVFPNGKKSFIPLENNPEVFTSLIHDLGVSPELGFYDVYSLDDPDLLSMIPRPVVALIFITPPPMYYAVRGADGTKTWKDGMTYDKSGADEPIMWFPQIIDNACGLMALIHSMANGEARQYVKKDSLLDRIFTKAAPLKPMPRAELLNKDDELEAAHMRAARRGHSNTPSSEIHAELHFLAFVKGEDGHLWDMDGATDGPVDHGKLDNDGDMLSQEALEKGVKRYLAHSNGNPNFSIVALAKQPVE